MLSVQRTDYRSTGTGMNPYVHVGLLDLLLVVDLESRLHNADPPLSIFDLLDEIEIA